MCLSMGKFGGVGHASCLCVFDHSPNGFTCGGSSLEKTNWTVCLCGSLHVVSLHVSLNVSLWFCGVAGHSAWGWA